MSHVAAGDADGERGAPPGHLAHRRKIGLVLLLLLAAAGTWFMLYRDGPPDTPDGAGGAGTSQDDQASTGTEGRLVVNQTSVITGLSPGSPSQELRGTFTNPHSGPLHVRTVAAEVAATSRPGCQAEDFVVGGSPAPVGAEIAPGADQGSWSGLIIRMRDRPLNQDVCKDTRVTIRYTVQ